MCCCQSQLGFTAVVAFVLACAPWPALGPFVLLVRFFFGEARCPYSLPISRQMFVTKHGQRRAAERHAGKAQLLPRRLQLLQPFLLSLIFLAVALAVILGFVQLF